MIRWRSQPSQLAVSQSGMPSSLPIGDIAPTQFLRDLRYSFVKHTCPDEGAGARHGPTGHCRCVYSQATAKAEGTVKLQFDRQRTCHRNLVWPGLNQRVRTVTPESQNAK